MELGDYYSESLEDAQYACSQIEACGGVELLDVGYGHCLKGKISPETGGTSVWIKTGTMFWIKEKKDIYSNSCLKCLQILRILIWTNIFLLEKESKKTWK